MAFGYPCKKVVFDLVSGKLDKPVVIDKGDTKIVRVTYQQMEDLQSCRQIMHLIGELLHSDASSKPEWDQQVRRVNELALARSA